MATFMFPMPKDAFYCKWSDLIYQGQSMIIIAVLPDRQFLCHRKCEKDYGIFQAFFSTQIIWVKCYSVR